MRGLKHEAGRSTLGVLKQERHFDTHVLGYLTKVVIFQDTTKGAVATGIGWITTSVDLVNLVQRVVKTLVAFGAK